MGTRSAGKAEAEDNPRPAPLAFGGVQASASWLLGRTQGLGSAEAGDSLPPPKHSAEPPLAIRTFGSTLVILNQKLEAAASESGPSEPISCISQGLWG